MKKLPKIKLNIPLTITAIAVVSVVIELVSLYIQPGIFRQTLYDIVTRPLLIPLNLFPVIIAVVIGYFACKNVMWGSAPAAVLFPVLSYINLLKIEGRDDAFVPADIGLIREALTAATDYDLDMHWWIIVGIVFFVAIMVFLGFIIKTPSPRPIIRISCVVLTVVTFVASMKFVYSDKKLYDSFSVKEKYNIPFVFNTLGFNYCFLYNMNLYPIDKPDGFSKAEVESWQQQYLKTDTESDKTPNIIMVMGEAFSDISNDDVFDYATPEDNPIYSYNKLCESDRALSGHIVVPNIFAGTANTEFDIMTGTPTNMISDLTTSSFRVVHRSTPSLASVTKDLGYNTYFMHPGSNWFYNRNSVYEYFGMTDLVFSEKFDLEKDKKGGFVSDKAFLSQLISDIEARKQDPFFMYTVTLQNHQTYSYGKYSEMPKKPPLKTEISDKAMEYLSSYLVGVKDTADMVYELSQYVDTLDKPTLLVFFGDHLPNLGANNLAYSELGMSLAKGDTPQNILQSYETPFVIYANTAYCNDTDIKEDFASLELPQNNTINSIYLGAVTFELAGIEGKDSYFDFLNDARRILPVFRAREKVYMLPDCTYTDILTDPKGLDILDKIDKWQYYRLKH